MNFIGKLSQNIITSEISKNGGISNSEMQPSIKATKKMAKLSHSAFLGFGKLKLAAARRTLNEEKPGHFSKNREFCGILPYLSPIPQLSNSAVALK